MGDSPREHRLPTSPIIDTSALLQLSWHHTLVKDSGQLACRAEPRNLPLCLDRRKVPIACFDGGARGRVLAQMLEFGLAEGPKLSLRAQEFDVFDCRETVTRESQGPDGARHEVDRDHFLDPLPKVRGYHRCRLFPVLVRCHDAVRDLPVRGLALRHCLRVRCSPHVQSVVETERSPRTCEDRAQISTGA